MVSLALRDIFAIYDDQRIRKSFVRVTLGSGSKTLPIGRRLALCTQSICIEILAAGLAFFGFRSFPFPLAFLFFFPLPSFFSSLLSAK